jgi:uncharacterized Zn finger protein (UPF0148 family)
MKPLKKSACPNCGYVKPKKTKNGDDIRCNICDGTDYYKRLTELRDEKRKKKYEKYYNYCKRYEELNDEKILKNNNNIE